MITYKKHLVIPDTQIKTGVPTAHLRWIGQYIVDTKPDVVIHMGDHADMPSLSVYDKGKIQFEGRRYQIDIAMANEGWRLLNKPLVDFNNVRKAYKERQWWPERHITLGNHEERIDRCVADNPILEGAIGLHDLDYANSGWTVHEFLKPVDVDGIRYCHYFPRSPNGRVMQNRRGAPNAKAQLQREMMSCTAGHMQGFDYWEYGIQGRRLYSIIAGSCYLHDESYLTPQGTDYWRGIIVKHEVRDGEYDLMKVSLDYLCRRYEGMTLADFMRTA